MYKIDCEDLISYLAKYATNFIYIDGYRFTGDASENFRFEATKYLGELKSQLTVGALASVLRQEGVSERIIITAVKGLGDSGNKEAIPHIYRMSLGHWFYDDRVAGEYAPSYWGFRYSEELKKEAKNALKKLGVSKIDEIEASIHFLKHYGKITRDYELFMEDIIEIIGKNVGIVISELLKEKQKEPLLYNIMEYIWYSIEDERITSNLFRNIIDFQRTYVETKEYAIENMPITDTKQELINYLVALADRNTPLIPQIAKKLVDDLNAYKEATPLILKVMNSEKFKEKREKVLSLLKNPEIDINIRLPELIKRYKGTQDEKEKSNVLNTILDLADNERSLLQKQTELFQKATDIIAGNLLNENIRLRERAFQILFKYYGFSNKIAEILKKSYLLEEDFRLIKLYIQLFENESSDDVISILQKKVKENQNIVSCKEEIVYLFNVSAENSKQDLLNLLKAPMKKYYLVDIFKDIPRHKLEIIISELLEIVTNEKENTSLVYTLISSVIKRYRIIEAIPLLRKIIVTPPNDEVKRIASQALFDLYLGKDCSNFQKMNNRELISIVEGMHKKSDLESDNHLIPVIPHLTNILQISSNNDEKIRAMNCIYLINSNVRENKRDFKLLRSNLKETEKVLLTILKEDKETMVRVKAAFTLRIYNKQKGMPFLKKKLYMPKVIRNLLYIMQTEIDEIAASCIQTLEFFRKNLRITYDKNENLYFRMMGKVVDLKFHIENELLASYIKIKNNKDFKSSIKTLQDIGWLKNRINNSQKQR